MGKIAPDATIDASLDYIGGSNFMTVCSGSPATFTDAWTTNLLAKFVMTSGCFTKADDTSGRKTTMTAKTAGSITANGFAEAVALVEAGGSTLRFVTTCTGQNLTLGGTVDVPSWKINIQDPT